MGPKETTVFKTILNLVTIRVILYNAKGAERKGKRLPSHPKAIIESGCIEASRLLKNFGFELIRLEIFIDISAPSQASTIFFS